MVRGNLIWRSFSALAAHRPEGDSLPPLDLLVGRHGESSTKFSARRHLLRSARLVGRLFAEHLDRADRDIRRAAAECQSCSSSTERTFDASSSKVKGFGKSCTPASNLPLWTIALRE